MKPFWRGFFSIFQSMGELFNFSPKVIRKVKSKPYQWYHRGPWWEHPIHGDVWKDTKTTRRHK